MSEVIEQNKIPAGLSIRERPSLQWGWEPFGSDKYGRNRYLRRYMAA